VNIRERISEVLELKAHEIRPWHLHRQRRKMESIVAFLERRGVTEAMDVTMRHMLDLMRTWPRYNDLSAIVEMRKLKFFLQRISRHDLAGELRPPKQTKQGRERRLPRPYSDEEIKKFRAVASPEVDLFFRASIETGLACCDLVQLKPENLRDGCVMTHRQKTGKQVIIPVSQDLVALLKVRLPFWRPPRSHRFQTGVMIWSDKVRVTQQKAGIWQKGALTHRGRDSFVERQLEAGVPLPVIAARLGDLVSTVERHYAHLLSHRLRQQNLDSPVVRI
jgi:integrase